MSPRIRILVCAVATLVAVAIFYKAALAPRYARASAVQAQIDKSQATVDATRATGRTLEAAKAAYSNDYATVIGLGKAVPADDDMRSLLVQMDGAAKRSGVDFRSIQLDESDPAASSAGTGAADATQAASAALPPGASVGAAGLPTMPFSFEFQGSFLDLSGFMARLERFVVARGDGLDVKGRLLTIDGFALKPSADGFPQMTASVGATAYLVNPSEGASGGATAAGPAATVAPGGGSTSTAPAAADVTAGGLR